MEHIANIVRCHNMSYPSLNLALLHWKIFHLMLQCPRQSALLSSYRLCLRSPIGLWGKYYYVYAIWYHTLFFFRCGSLQILLFDGFQDRSVSTGDATWRETMLNLLSKKGGHVLGWNLVRGVWEGLGGWGNKRSRYLHLWNILIIP